MTRALQASRGMCVAAAGLVVAFIGLSFQSLVAADARATESTRHTAAFAGELFGLNDDRLLLSSHDGYAQLRNGAGVWGDVFQLPLPSATSIVPDDRGFLISAVVGEDFVVVQMSGDGTELTRWLVPTSFDRVAVDERVVRVVSPTDSRTLEASGKLGPSVHIPRSDRADWQPRRSPLLLERDGDTVVCDREDYSMQHASPARCERLGKRAWRFEGRHAFRDLPLVCGAWLVMLAGERFDRIEVRSLETGAVEARKNYARTPTLACGADSALFVGEKRLSRLRLPSLATDWSARVQAPPIEALAITKRWLAYSVGRSREVVVLMRR